MTENAEKVVELKFLASEIAEILGVDPTREYAEEFLKLAERYDKCYDEIGSKAKAMIAWLIAMASDIPFSEQEKEFSGDGWLSKFGIYPTHEDQDWVDFCLSFAQSVKGSFRDDTDYDVIDLENYLRHSLIKASEYEHRILALTTQIAFSIEVVKSVNEAMGGLNSVNEDALREFIVKLTTTIKSSREGRKTFNATTKQKIYKRLDSNAKMLTLLSIYLSLISAGFIEIEVMEDFTHYLDTVFQGVLGSANAKMDILKLDKMRITDDEIGFSEN